MKTRALYILMTAFITCVIFTPAVMADSCCPSDKAENFCQTSQVNGYQLQYKFIDLKEKMKGMGQQMEGLTATHHLMVFIKNGKGETIAADKVGFLISGPDGKDQKLMAMGMSGGYGADVNLPQPGDYTVKTKAVMGEQKLMDTFTYTIK